MDPEPECQDINVQVFVPDYHVQKYLQVPLDETVWEIKQKVLTALPQDQTELFNYGLFLPPCNGRAGKFLLEERPLRDYPFQDCVPYLELKYKKRVYKMMNVDEKTLKNLHSKSNLKKFMELVAHKQVEKVEKLLNHGLDPNFHDAQGETPLTIAAGIVDSRHLLMTLVAGGSHLDFRNLEGQTPLHKAAFLENPNNVKTLLELGSSPNYRDPLGLTPLYYCMLQPNTSADAAELLLRDFANTGINDPHGNQELHQACKNGLVQHVEHLLYYGADINTRNVNGNTPLHVCAVNNRENCARVLLFRGADSSTQNNQKQTAHHVAIIVGNTGVADVIRTHDPAKCVPYRGMPRYNSKRRQTITRTPSLSRHRSFSQSSICSNSSSDHYGSIHRSSTTTNARMIPPSPARARTDSVHSLNHAPRPPQPSENGYGTLPMKKFHPEAFGESSTGVNDLNVPRILVIPRGPKGFGFILRGAKKMEPGVQFEPSPTVPGLQFFEGVDMNGMAMKAGLQPGDFLLEINRVDVRCASHDQVVALIQNTAETITLKVITVDVEKMTIVQSPYGTLPNRRMKARTLMPPPPPRRHPSTSLSVASGRNYTDALLMFDEPRSSNIMSPAKSMEALPRQHSLDAYHDPNAFVNGDEKVASVRNRPNSRRISALELEQLMARQQPDQMDDANHAPRKFSSVADMKRKKHQKANVPALPGLPRTQIYQESNAVPDHPVLKSFASSPDLQQSSVPRSGYAASNRYWPHEPSTPRDDVFGTPVGSRRTSDASSTSEYSRPFRPTSRPKTPPPPPPVTNHNAPNAPPPPPPLASNLAPPPPPCPPPPPEALRTDIKKQEGHYSSVKTSGVQADCHGISAEALTSVKLNKTPNKAHSESNLRSSPANKKLSTGAITPEALSAVKLKSTNQNGTKPVPKFFIPEQTDGIQGVLRQGMAQRRQAVGNTDERPIHDSPSSDDNTPSNRSPPKVDFDSDLKAALARRRTKLDVSPNVENNNNNNKPDSTIFTTNKKPPSAPRIGLSLKESIQQSVSPKPPPKSSPPPPVTNGFGTKKDSGYTSSRTSLEPSECGDEPSTNGTTVLRIDPNQPCLPMGQEISPVDFPPPPPPEFLNASMNGPSDVGNKNRVSILSQQLEDTFGGVPPPTLPKKPAGLKRELQMPPKMTNQGRANREQDAVSVTSTLSTLSGCSESTSDRSSQQQPSPPLAPPLPLMPPPDYDADSGTGDSESEDVTPNLSRLDLSSRVPTMEFASKALPSWLVTDVCDWLDSLCLSEYKKSFLCSHTDGKSLMKHDRALFTRLGVTRIAHRKSMESSLKNYMPNGTEF